jgi:hypothetical protein
MVTAIVWKYNKKTAKGLFDKILGGSIRFFTREPSYSHIGIYVQGKFYQNTIERVGTRVVSGAIKSEGLPVSNHELVYLKLKQSVDENKLIAFLDGTVSNSQNYSVIKLLLFIMVYPFNGFWKLIKRVPFPHFRGAVCSVYVERALEYLGIDYIVPSELDDWLAPIDFIDSSLFEKVDKSKVI